MDGLESRRVLEATVRLSAATFNNKVSERPSLLSFRAERPENVDTFLVFWMGGTPVAGPASTEVFGICFFFFFTSPEAKGAAQ
jgi:hypothetical protein